MLYWPHMAEIIRVPNFDSVNLKEVTFIDADAESGQANLTLFNETVYSAGHKVLIGNIAQENSEVGTIGNISGKSVTLAANLVNKHIRGEAFTLLFGDQIRLYRATNVDGNAPADSAFSYLSVYATIQGDDATSDLVDPSGGSSYWYKTTYYNSGTGDETSLALSVAVRGGSYGKLVSVSSVREEAGLLDNRNIPDPTIAERRDQAEDEVLGALATAGYTVPLQSSNGQPYVPPMVENIVRMLAAGYVMMTQYPNVEGESNPGKKKVDEANRILKQIQKQEITLLDASKAPLARTSQVSGWPDNTTELVGTDGTPEPIQMRMSKRF